MHPLPSRRSLLATAGAGALLAGCESTDILNRLVPKSSYALLPNQDYGPHLRHAADVYLPLSLVGAAPAPAAPPPLVVFFYGGSWTRGDRADYRFVGEALAASGLVAVIADYRLSPEVRYPAFLADCAAATAWAWGRAREFGADPQRVFLMGHSAGAYNAAMLALDPRWLHAVGRLPSRLAGWIGLAGVYDFLPIRNPEVQQAFGWPDTPADSQPLAHVSRVAPPTLLLAPRNDAVVDPVRNTQGLADRLRAAGAPVQAQLLGGVSHATLPAAMAKPLRWMAPVLQQVLAFVTAPPGAAAGARPAA